MKKLILLLLIFSHFSFAAKVNAIYGIDENEGTPNSAIILLDNDTFQFHVKFDNQDTTYVAMGNYTTNKTTNEVSLTTLYTSCDYDLDTDVFSTFNLNISDNKLYKSNTISYDLKTELFLANFNSNYGCLL